MPERNQIHELTPFPQQKNKPMFKKILLNYHPATFSYVNEAHIQFKTSCLHNSNNKNLPFDDAISKRTEILVIPIQIRVLNLTAGLITFNETLKYPDAFCLLKWPSFKTLQDEVYSY